MQYAGVMACKKYKYVLVLDDDVILPPDLDMGLDLIHGDTIGVAFPIRAAHPKRIYSLFTEWQSLEYQLTGYNKLMQYKTGSVQYPHGAASLWDRKALKTALRSHDTVFYAEDAKLGLWALKNGYSMAIKPEVPILTEAPTTLLGEMPNYWTQRVRSWDMALHAYFWQYVQIIFTSYSKSCCGLVFMKATQLYTVYTIVADWLRLPVLVLYLGGAQLSYLTFFGLYVAASIVLLLAWNITAYWKRPDLRLSYLCVFTFPLYAGLVLVTRFFGLLRALFVYLPNYRRPMTIPEIEHKVMESWKEAMLAEEAGIESDDDDDDFDEDDLLEAVGVSLPPPEPRHQSDCREPVWLTDDELISLGITTKSSATGLVFQSRAAALGQDTRSLATVESDGILRKFGTSSRAVTTTNKSLLNTGRSRIQRGRNKKSTPVDLDDDLRTKKSTLIDLDEDMLSTDSEIISDPPSISSKDGSAGASPNSAKNRVSWNIQRQLSKLSAATPDFRLFPYAPKVGQHDDERSDDEEEQKHGSADMQVIGSDANNRNSATTDEKTLHRVAWSMMGSVETILCAPNNNEKKAQSRPPLRNVSPKRERIAGPPSAVAGPVEVRQKHHKISSQSVEQYRENQSAERYRRERNTDSSRLDKERVKHILEKASRRVSTKREEDSGLVYIDI